MLLYLLIVITAGFYYYLCYETNRQDFVQVIVLYTTLFASYYILLKSYSVSHFKQLLIVGIVFRILLLFSVPNLSDDVYRFIWDGRLLAEGINPFAHLPEEVIKMRQVPGITNHLFQQLNSPAYYTIYPPVLQAIFWFNAKLFPTNVFQAIMCFKFIIVLAETGTILIIPLVLKRLQLPVQSVLLYTLNPLVIAELAGNVHFEAVMIFFVVLAFLALLQSKTYRSAAYLSLGISSKLIPVLFVPLIIKKLGLKQGVTYTVVSGLITIALFWFIIDKATISHFFKSVNLFLSQFEFNASLYYLVRWLGSLITGYNIIAYAGPLLSLTAAIIIFILSIQGGEVSERRFFLKALSILTIYYLLATTVHPWYISMPVALAVFTRYRYPIIWSFTATLSYAAYQTNPVQENLWLIAAGYVLMIAYGCWEYKIKKESR